MSGGANRALPSDDRCNLSRNDRYVKDQVVLKSDPDAHAALVESGSRSGYTIVDKLTGGQNATATAYKCNNRDPIGIQYGKFIDKSIFQLN